MSSRYLLDTNAAIAYLNGEAEVEKLIREAEAVFVPIIVLGELFFGAQKSSRVERNLAQIENFMQGRSILLCDVETARLYGRIAESLKKKGNPIQSNDMWIAAIAQQYHLTLLTRDTDFKRVAGLPVQSW